MLNTVVEKHEYKETITAKPCWSCFKAYPISKRKCSCGRALSRIPTFVDLDGKHIVSIPKSAADKLRDDGSYTWNLTPFLTNYCECACDRTHRF